LGVVGLRQLFSVRYAFYLQLAVVTPNQRSRPTYEFLAMQAQPGVFLVVKLICQNIHKSHSMNRMPLTFAFCVGFGSLGLQWAAAQQQGPTNPGERVTLERAKPGYLVPQALVPAQPPVLAQPPGYMSRGSPSATPNPRPQAGAKTAAVNPPARQIVPGTKGTAKEPEQIKIVRVYHGEGYFDLALAEKLQPLLAKAYGTTPASNLNPGNNRSVPDLLRSILGQDQGSAKSADQNTVAKASQP
jgi:hypothetical protein